MGSTSTLLAEEMDSSSTLLAEEMDSSRLTCFHPPICASRAAACNCPVSHYMVTCSSHVFLATSRPFVHAPGRLAGTSL
jgi:hypothetical protein